MTPGGLRELMAERERTQRDLARRTDPARS